MADTGPGDKSVYSSVLCSLTELHTPGHNVDLLSDCSVPAYYTHTHTQSERRYVILTVQ